MCTEHPWAHGPCTRSILTGVQGSFWPPVNTGGIHGLWSWIVCTEHPWTHGSCTRSILTGVQGSFWPPVNTGGIHGLWSWIVCSKHQSARPVLTVCIWTRVGRRKHVLGGVHTGAVFGIPLNCPCAVVMRPVVKWRWPLVSIIIRLHRMYYMHRCGLLLPNELCGLSIGLSVCHTSECCKNGSTDQDAIWVEDSGGP